MVWLKRVVRLCFWILSCYLGITLPKFALSSLSFPTSFVVEKSLTLLYSPHLKLCQVLLIVFLKQNWFQFLFSIFTAAATASVYILILSPSSMIFLVRCPQSLAKFPSADKKTNTPICSHWHLLKIFHRISII